MPLHGWLTLFPAGGLEGRFPGGGGGGGGPPIPGIGGGGGGGGGIVVDVLGYLERGLAREQWRPWYYRRIKAVKECNRERQTKHRQLAICSLLILKDRRCLEKEFKEAAHMIVVTKYARLRGGSLASQSDMLMHHLVSSA